MTWTTSTKSASERQIWGSDRWSNLKIGKTTLVFHSTLTWTTGMAWLTSSHIGGFNWGGHGCNMIDEMSSGLVFHVLWACFAYVVLVKRKIRSDFYCDSPSDRPCAAASYFEVHGLGWTNKDEHRADGWVTVGFDNQFHLSWYEELRAIHYFASSTCLLSSVFVNLSKIDLWFRSKFAQLSTVFDNACLPFDTSCLRRNGQVFLCLGNYCID